MSKKFSCSCLMCIQSRDTQKARFSCSACKFARRKPKNGNYAYCLISGIPISLQTHHGCKYGQKKILKVDKQDESQYLPE